jgi:Vault protein inter-alpha-trypsin domain
LQRFHRVKDSQFTALNIAVNITQTYHNTGESPIEAIYKFPMHEGAAICGFEAEIEGRKVVGIVREIGEAVKIYEQGLKVKCIAAECTYKSLPKGLY